MSAKDATLSIAGLGSWIAFLAALVTSKTGLLTEPTEPLLNPTTASNVLLLLALGLGLVSTVLVVNQILKVGGAKFPVFLAFAGAVLFCSLLLLAIFRYHTYGT